MGLTLHYELHAPHVLSPDSARDAVARLREHALSLHFKECSKLIEWHSESDDPEIGKWRRYLVCYDETGDEKKYLSALPIGFYMFTVRQPGSETASFGLATYEENAADMHDPSIRRPTNLPGYHWYNFCKTQYASLSNHGGWDNFFKIHDGICKVLDHASSLGINVVVRDDGNYWPTRDQAALRDQIDYWNNLIAAFTGKFKDMIGERADGTLVAPINSDPNYERMEAKGQKLLGKFDPKDLDVE